MDRTPTKHLEIMQISGNAAAIEERGREIESLGQQMNEAAKLLDDIDMGAETRGKSLDAIKDVVGDAADDLRTAGTRYEPSGKVLWQYGAALETAQTRITNLMPDLETAWSAYTTEYANWEADEQLPDPEPGESTSARTTWSDVERERDTWETHATTYEGIYETWWSAYEDARKGIEDANDEGVEDNWVDDHLEALELALDILSYAGIALALVACILGGPFILLAALAGLAALALTVIKVTGGHGNGWDIAMAAVGVFPFGKAAGLFKGAGKLAALRGMGGDIIGAGFRNGSRASQVITRGTGAQIFTRGGTLNQNGTRVIRDFFGGFDGPSLASRLYRGHEGAYASMLSDAAGGLSNKARGNLQQFLGGTPGGGVVQDMLSGGSTSGALDFIDNMGKASAGFAYDRATGGW